jgi:ABC-type metal ion transport system substrate-binding protein
MKKVITAATLVAITALTSCGGAEEKVDETVHATETVDAANLYEETLKTEEEIDELNLEIEELNEVEIELDELESELDNI